MSAWTLPEWRSVARCGKNYDLSRRTACPFIRRQPLLLMPVTDFVWFVTPIFVMISLVEAQ